MFNRNCFTQFMSKSWWRPRVAVDNIRFFLRGFKYAAQRARQGWCESDVWNLDLYLEAVIVDTLRELADTSHGYPGNDEFPTFESWQNWLRETADMIEAEDEDEDTLWPNKETEARRKEGLKRVFEYIDYLWD